VLKLSIGFFGALAGARFFFGFRPRLLGIGVEQRHHCEDHPSRQRKCFCVYERSSQVLSRIALRGRRLRTSSERNGHQNGREPVTIRGD
jgi:hypothetical protein